MKTIFGALLMSLWLLNPLFSSVDNRSLDTLHHLYGAIAGKYGITMNIFIRGSQVSGSMYYNRVGQYIYLKGTIDGAGHMQLVGSLENGQKTDFFDGRYDGKIFQGKWHTTGNNRMLDFKLRRTNKNWVLTKKIVWQVKDSIKKAGGWVHFKIIEIADLPKAYPIPEAGEKISASLREDLEITGYQDFVKNAQEQISLWKEDAENAEEDSYAAPSDLDAFDSTNIYVNVFKLFLTVKTEDFYKDPEILPRYSMSYNVYDLYSGETVYIDDLFTTPEEVLKKVIIPELLKNYKADYQEDLTKEVSIDEIDLPDCFGFTVDGIEFVYYPESIASWSARGPYSFIVPYSEILPYLKPYYKKRFK